MQLNNRTEEDERFRTAYSSEIPLICFLATRCVGSHVSAGRYGYANIATNTIFVSYKSAQNCKNLIGGFFYFPLSPFLSLPAVEDEH